MTNSKKRKKNDDVNKSDDKKIDADETMRMQSKNSNSETVKINPIKTQKIGFGTDKIQHMDNVGDPDDFELDLELAHKKDKQKEAEIIDLDLDIRNGDEIDEDSVKPNFIVGDIGDEVDTDILPMILKRNSQMLRKYDIDDLKDIKINIKKNK